jgi:hypothetical protein
MSGEVPTAGFLLTVGPGEPRFGACLEAARRARESGTEVYFYALDAGIAALGDPRLAALTGPRFHVLGCAYAAERRGLARCPEYTYGGLKMLSDLIAHTAEFHSF